MQARRDRPVLVLRLAGRGASGGPNVRQADAALAARIRAVHAVDVTYGAPRITAELNDGVPARPAGQPQAGGPGHARPPDRRGPAAPAGAHHDPRARRPGRARPARTRLHRRASRTRSTSATSPTCPAGPGKFLYLATVIDCYSRRLVGWSIADHMRTDLVTDALRAAARATRLPGRGDLPLRPRRPVRLQGPGHALHPSGRDSLDGRGRDLRRQRDGRVVQRDPQTRDPRQAPAAGPTTSRHAGRSFAWITRYNTRRRHSTCGYLSPIDVRERPPRRYAAASPRETTRVSTIRGQAPSTTTSTSHEGVAPRPRH